MGGNCIHSLMVCINPNLGYYYSCSEWCWLRGQSIFSNIDNDILGNELAPLMVDVRWGHIFPSVTWLSHCMWSDTREASGSQLWHYPFIWGEKFILSWGLGQVETKRQLGGLHAVMLTHSPVITNSRCQTLTFLPHSLFIRSGGIRLCIHLLAEHRSVNLKSIIWTDTLLPPHSPLLTELSLSVL